MKVRLRDGATGVARWSEDFEIPLDPSRGPEGALAWRLSEPLRVAAQSVAEGGDLSQAALETYFVARRLVREGGLNDPDDAVTLLDEVLSVAPAFGPAHAARTMASVRGWTMLRATPGLRDWYDEAQTSIARSMELAPERGGDAFREGAPRVAARSLSGRRGGHSRGPLTRADDARSPSGARLAPARSGAVAARSGAPRPRARPRRAPPSGAVRAGALARAVRRSRLGRAHDRPPRTAARLGASRGAPAGRARACGGAIPSWCDAGCGSSNARTFRRRR